MATEIAEVMVNDMRAVGYPRKYRIEQEEIERGGIEMGGGDRDGRGRGGQRGDTESQMNGQRINAEWQRKLRIDPVRNDLLRKPNVQPCMVVDIYVHIHEKNTQVTAMKKNLRYLINVNPTYFLPSLLGANVNFETQGRDNMKMRFFFE